MYTCRSQFRIYMDQYTLSYLGGSMLHAGSFSQPLTFSENGLCWHAFDDHFEAGMDKVEFWRKWPTLLALSNPICIN